MKSIWIGGPQRGGNHAISTWVINHYDKVIYRNDILVSAYDYVIVTKGKKGQICQDPLQTGLDIIVGFEKCTLPMYVEKHKTLHRGLDRYILVVMRNPFNLLASVMAYRGRRGGWKLDPGRAMDLWVQIAREHLGETNRLDGLNSKIVNYDRWFVSEEYRRQISDFLDLEHTDAGLNRVSSYGGGSSFDKKRYHGKAQEMDVLNRWKVFADDRVYLDFLKRRPKIIELAEKIGWTIPI